MITDVNTVIFGNNSTPGQDVLNSDAFKTFSNSFQTQFMNFLNGTNPNFNGDEVLKTISPDLTGDYYLHTIMGGYQFLQVNVNVSDDHVDFRYTFTDHFGAGIGDSGSALPGLASMYFDQHNYGNSSQYTPFIWSISVSTSVPR